MQLTLRGLTRIVTVALAVSVVAMPSQVAYAAGGLLGEQVIIVDDWQANLRAYWAASTPKPERRWTI